mgnify:CR=1 FL=1
MEVVKLENHKNSYSLAILRDGSIIDPRALPNPRPQDIEVMEDEFGNVVNVTIPRDKVLVVYHVSIQPNSTKYYVEIVSNDVIDVKVKSRKEIEEVNEGYKIVTRYYDAKYIEIVLRDNNVVEALVDKKQVKAETTMIGKPRVYVLVDEGMIEAFGDTFYLKDLFRGLGFKWDISKKRWVLKGGDVNTIIEKLKANAEVKIIQNRQAK